MAKNKNREIQNLVASSITPLGIKEFLRKIIVEFESQNSTAWNKEVKATNKKYHCQKILKKGIEEIIFKDNFTEEKLTRQEISCLLNYYYFPILFESSSLIFSTIWDRRFEELFVNNNALIFINLGPDLIASSIAFGQIYKDKLKVDSMWDRSNMKRYYFNSYIFISEAHLSKNRQNLAVLNSETLDCQNPDSQFEYDMFNLVNEPIWPSHEYIISDIFMDGKISNLSNGSKLFDFRFFDLKMKLFKKLTFINENYDGELPLFELIEKFDKNKCFIVNVNFLCANRVFNSDNIYLFLSRLFVEYHQANFAIVFQNNGNQELQNEWDVLKSRVSMESIKTGFVSLSCNEKIQISYEVLFSSKYERLNFH
jgi:hypothetical protein